MTREVGFCPAHADGELWCLPHADADEAIAAVGDSQELVAKSTLRDTTGIIS